MDTEAARRSVLESRDTGSCRCAECGKELEPNEPVVRTKKPDARKFEFFCLEHSPYLLDGELLQETSCTWPSSPPPIPCCSHLTLPE